jgi:hypothetical protein
MKGSVVDCIAKLVQTKFGRAKWEQILVGAGLRSHAFFLPIQDVNDETVFAILGSLCRVLQLSQKQALDAFAEYWMNDYGRKVYPTYFRGMKNSKDFLLKMDSVHEQLTKHVPNARPPRFTYEWKNENTLIMGYESPRNLIDLMVSMTKAVGTYYRENLIVEKLSDKQVQITFPT